MGFNGDSEVRLTLVESHVWGGIQGRNRWSKEKPEFVLWYISKTRPRTMELAQDLQQGRLCSIAYINGVTP